MYAVRRCVVAFVGKGPVFFNGIAVILTVLILKPDTYGNDLPIMLHLAYDIYFVCNIFCHS